MTSLLNNDVSDAHGLSAPAVIFNSGVACSVRGYFFARLKCITRRQLDYR